MRFLLRKTSYFSLYDVELLALQYLSFKHSLNSDLNSEQGTPGKSTPFKSYKGENCHKEDKEHLAASLIQPPIKIQLERVTFYKKFMKFVGWFTLPHPGLKTRPLEILFKLVGLYTIPLLVWHCIPHWGQQETFSRQSSYPMGQNPSNK